MIYGGAPAGGGRAAECSTSRRCRRATLKRCLIRYLPAGLVRLRPVRLRTQRAAGAGQLCAVAVGLAEPVSQPDERSALERVFIIGRHDGEDFSSGIDSPEDLASLPSGFAGGIWTNRIDRDRAAAAEAVGLRRARLHMLSVNVIAQRSEAIQLCRTSQRNWIASSLRSSQ